MQKSADGQYEMVLENRQVLTIFFAVVVLCGVFFGLGYIVGKNTMGYIPPADPDPIASGKKSAIAQADMPREEAAAPASDANAQKAPEEKTAPAKLEPAPAEKQPELRPAAASVTRPGAADATITLQVAALSKKEDADALLGLLTRKGFPASLTSNSADRLYRVQVGPFASTKDSEEMKARLEQEGFRPITKK